MEENIKVLKKGNYFKVYKDGYCMATYSSITGRMWGATRYFLFKRNLLFKKYYVVK